MKLKTVTVPRGYDGLHLEVPGCVINVYVGLTDDDGRAVTTVRVTADQYSGEPRWYCRTVCACGKSVERSREYQTDSAGVRVVQEKAEG